MIKEDQHGSHPPRKPGWLEMETSSQLQQLKCMMERNRADPSPVLTQLIPIPIKIILSRSGERPLECMNLTLHPLIIHENHLIRLSDSV